MFVEKSNPDHHWRAGGAPGECPSARCPPHGCTAAHEHRQHQPGALPAQHHGLTAGERAVPPAAHGCLGGCLVCGVWADWAGSIRGRQLDLSIRTRVCPRGGFGSVLELVESVKRDCFPDPSQGRWHRLLVKHAEGRWDLGTLL